MNIKIKPKKTLYCLFLVIGLLLAAHIIVQTAILKFGADPFEDTIRFFNFNSEGNFPSYYSSLALLSSSIFLYLIGKNFKGNLSKEYLYWYGLSIIFLYLALDENISIHESILSPLRRLTRSSHILAIPWLSWVSANGYILKTILSYIWVVPYGIGFFTLSLIYFNFIKELPRRILTLFVVSGTMYVLGAMGFELISGFEATVHSQNTVLYAVLSTIEEVLEMLGIALFNYALLEYISEQVNRITFHIEKI